MFRLLQKLKSPFCIFPFLPFHAFTFNELIFYPFCGFDVCGTVYESPTRF